MAKTVSTIFSFLLGAAVGAAVALLYAPTSGEELRGQIRTEADVRLEKLSAEWEKAIAELQASVDKTRTEVMTYLEQMQEETAQVEDVEAVAEEDLSAEEAA